MVLGSMSAAGVFSLHFINGIFNADEYNGILGRLTCAIFLYISKDEAVV